MIASSCATRTTPRNGIERNGLQPGCFRALGDHGCLGLRSEFEEQVEWTSNDAARTRAPGVVSWSSHSLLLDAL
jgi:hypothetical protein